MSVARRRINSLCRFLWDAFLGLGGAGWVMVEKKEKGKARSSTIASPEGAGIADVVGCKVKKEALGPGQVNQRVWGFMLLHDLKGWVETMDPKQLNMGWNHGSRVRIRPL
jgi:hypothetical protein